MDDLRVSLTRVEEEWILRALDHIHEVLQTPEVREAAIRGVDHSGATVLVIIGSLLKLHRSYLAGQAHARKLIFRILGAVTRILLIGDDEAESPRENPFTRALNNMLRQAGRHN